MQRRFFLALPALLSAAGAVAQPLPPPLPPAEAPVGTPAAPPSDQPRGRRPRASVNEKTWDQLTPRQRRKIQQRLAGEGNPALAPEDARRRWDDMTARQRRSATRRTDGTRTAAPRDGRPPRDPAAPRDRMTQ